MSAAVGFGGGPIRMYDPTPEDAEAELIVTGMAADASSANSGHWTSASSVQLKIFGRLCLYQAAQLETQMEALRAAHMAFISQAASTVGANSLTHQLTGEIEAVLGRSWAAQERLRSLGARVIETAREYEAMGHRVQNLWWIIGDYGPAAQAFAVQRNPVRNDPRLAWFWDYVAPAVIPGYVLTKYLPSAAVGAVLPGHPMTHQKIRNFMDIVLPDADYQQIFMVILPHILDQFIKNGTASLNHGMSVALVRSLAEAFGHPGTPGGVQQFTFMLGSKLQRNSNVEVQQIAPPGSSSAVGVGTTQRRASNSLKDLVSPYHEIADLDEPVIRIDKIVNPDNSVEWQVIIPGTNGMPWQNSKPWNWGDAVPAVGGLATPGMVGIMDAMRQAGIGGDEKVVLVGHSQGGALAMNIANQAAASGEFNVEGVVTVGSPVSNQPVPPGTHLLAFEHSEDPVPGLDGALNPVAPNITTIGRVLAESVNPDDAQGTGLHHAHDYHSYENTAALADESPDPIVLHAKKKLLGSVESGSKATSHYFEVKVGH